MAALEYYNVINYFFQLLSMPGIGRTTDTRKPIPIPIPIPKKLQVSVVHYQKTNIIKLTIKDSEKITEPTLSLNKKSLLSPFLDKLYYYIEVFSRDCLIKNRTGLMCHYAKTINNMKFYYTLIL